MSETTAERRSLSVKELRVQRDAGKAPVIVGWAALFGSPSQDLGGFVEQIDPAAFDWTLGESPDVRALIDHNSSLVLGRTTAGTLRLKTDAKGLKVEIDPPDTGYANDLLVSMERGDVDQMSFGFRVIEDSWDYTEDELPMRTLRKVDLDQGDVSVVTYPAYISTKVSVRAMEQAKASAVPPKPKKTPEEVRSEYYQSVRERIAAFRPVKGK